jgi:hypothetical protein
VCIGRPPPAPGEASEILYNKVSWKQAGKHHFFPFFTVLKIEISVDCSYLFVFVFSVICPVTSSGSLVTMPVQHERIASYLSASCDPFDVGKKDH